MAISIISVNGTNLPANDLYANKISSNMIAIDNEIIITDDGSNATYTIKDLLSNVIIAANVTPTGSGNLTLTFSINQTAYDNILNGKDFIEIEIQVIGDTDAAVANHSESYLKRPPFTEIVPKNGYPESSLSFNADSAMNIMWDELYDDNITNVKITIEAGLNFNSPSSLIVVNSTINDGQYTFYPRDLGITDLTTCRIKIEHIDYPDLFGYSDYTGIGFDFVDTPVFVFGSSGSKSTLEVVKTYTLGRLGTEKAQEIDDAVVKGQIEYDLGSGIVITQRDQDGLLPGQDPAEVDKKKAYNLVWSYNGNVDLTFEKIISYGNPDTNPNTYEDNTLTDYLGNPVNNYGVWLYKIVDLPAEWTLNLYSIPQTFDEYSYEWTAERVTLNNGVYVPHENQMQTYVKPVLNSRSFKIYVKAKGNNADYVAQADDQVDLNKDKLDFDLGNIIVRFKAVRVYRRV